MVFRELNEHLGAATSGGPSDVSGFVCECADISCALVLAVPLREYELVRRDSRRFIVGPADTHVDATVEKVIERHAGYWVVEKVGIAAAAAEDEHPAT